MIKTLYPTFRRWSDKGSVWLISDTHFDDADCKLMDKDWITPEEHLERLKDITKQDTVIHLGDVGNPEYIKQLKGHKVLITGNHDRGASYYESYFDEIFTGALIVAEKLILSHEPVDIPWLFNIHGHDHNPSHIGDINHINIASNVIGYKPISLSDVIKAGFLSNIDSLHQMTIYEASEHPLKGKTCLDL